MPLIQVPKNVRPCQVDDFGEEVERSRKGALYFMPGSTKVVTDGELKHLKDNHLALYSRLVVVPYDDKAGKLEKQKAFAVPSVVVPSGGATNPFGKSESDADDA